MGVCRSMRHPSSYSVSPGRIPPPRPALPSCPATWAKVCSVDTGSSLWHTTPASHHSLGSRMHSSAKWGVLTPESTLGLTDSAHGGRWDMLLRQKDAGVLPGVIFTCRSLSSRHSSCDVLLWLQVEHKVSLDAHSACSTHTLPCRECRAVLGRPRLVLPLSCEVGHHAMQRPCTWMEPDGQR